MRRNVQRKSGGREEEEKSERNDEEEQKGEEGGREEAVALRRVATSCTKGSDRTSYLTRACCASSVPTHLSPGPLLSSLSFSPRSRPLPSFPSAFGVPPLILSPARALVGSNLCLSLSLLVWFVGSRLGTVITEYPPLTSGTLVVLSPPLAHLLLPLSP